MNRRQVVQDGLRRFGFGWLGTRLEARARVVPGASCRGRTVRCEVLVTVPDVHDGVPRAYATEFHVDPEAAPSTWAAPLREALTARLLHEIDECLAFDQELVRDPHAR